MLYRFEVKYKNVLIDKIEIEAQNDIEAHDKIADQSYNSISLTLINNNNIKDI